MNVKYLKNMLCVGETTALRPLDALTERQVLTETMGKSRDHVWQYRGIFDALDPCASVIRRMSAC